MIPAALLPGIRGDAREWRRLLPWLPPTATALDLPTLDAPRATLADHAAALLPRLPDGPLVLVGASFGGLLARALDGLAPGRILGMILIGTLPSPTPAARRATRSAPFVRRLPGRLYRELYGARARADWLADDPDLDAYSALTLPDRRVLASRLGAIGRWGLPGRPRAPTWLLWGATDGHVMWSHEDATRAGLEPVIVPGGHRPHLSHPGAVAPWVAHARSIATGRGSP